MGLQFVQFLLLYMQLAVLTEMLWNLSPKVH